MRTDHDLTKSRRLDAVSLVAGLIFLAVALVWGIGGLRLGPDTAWQLPTVLVGCTVVGSVVAAASRRRRG